MTLRDQPVVSEGGEMVERLIPGLGLLRYENFEAGQWLTKAGEPAKIARRRYLLNGEKLDSVSSIVGLLSKEALYYWYEDHGARGAVEAMRRGEDLESLPIENVVHRARALELGAKAAREGGADRGKAIHLAFQTLATTGEAPKFSDYPKEWWPWVKGCAKAWLQLDPEPIDVEFMVANPELGYAGRPDLLCRSRGLRTIFDWKTSANGKIYEQAHYQTRGYAEGCEPSGIELPERIVIVAIDDGGNVELEDCVTTPAQWSNLVTAFHDRKNVNAAKAAAKREARKTKRGGVTA